MSPVYKFSNVGGFLTKNLYTSALAGNDIFINGNFESIETITLSSTTSYLEFTNIPNTYQHLQIRMIGRANVSSGYAQNIAIRFNADTGSNYSYHTLGAYTGNYTANTAAGAGNLTQASMFSGLSSISFASNIFGAAIIDILNYKDSNTYKTIRMIAGCEGGATDVVSTVSLSSGGWRSLNEVSSVRIYSPNGGLITNTTAALYGIRE